MAVGLDEVFKVLSKGVMVSINSQKYLDIAKFLMIDENFEELELLLKKIGFRLNGENGYFYISKLEKMNESELNSFFNNHKNIIVCIAILKQLFPYIDRSHILKQSDFIHQLKQKDDDALNKKFEFLFNTSDQMIILDKFFELLEKSFIIERKKLESKDEYLVLGSLEYYAKIIESAT